MGAIAASFANAGSAIDDMAQRTGLSAEAVSALDYAAKMSGSSIETVEESDHSMSKNLDAAASGSKEAQETACRLGFDGRRLGSLSPDERFIAIAQSLSEIEDPRAEAAEAMKISARAEPNWFRCYRVEGTASPT